MRRELTDLIAWLILPPAGLLLAILIGLALYLRGRRRLGLAVSLAAFSLLWIASLGVVGRSLAAMVELPAARPADLAGAQAIVVLGAGRILDAPEYGEDIVGGEGLVRLRYAARV